MIKLIDAIAIGNTWQWSMVNFGVEWLGVKIPFGQSFSTSDRLGILIEDGGSQQDKDDIKKVATYMHIIKGVTLFTFSVGIAL